MLQVLSAAVVAALAVVLGGIWLSCNANWKGIPPRQFTLRNDRLVAVTVQRINPTPGAIFRIASGSEQTFTESDRMYDNISSWDLPTDVILLDVRDEGGQRLGYLELQGRFLSITAGITICLSAATEPPFVINGTVDALRSCPAQ